MNQLLNPLKKEGLLKNLSAGIRTYYIPNFYFLEKDCDRDIRGIE